MLKVVGSRLIKGKDLFKNTKDKVFHIIGKAELF